MSTTSNTLSWVEVLRHRVAGGAVGISLATLVLVPSTGSIAPPAQARPHQHYFEAADFMTTVPDAVFEVRDRGLYYASEQGLKPVEWAPAPPSESDGQHSAAEDPRGLGAELSRSLLDLSGLKVNRLADAIGVSRAAYHKWLKGEGMSDDHLARLKDMQGTLLALRAIRRGNLREFLQRETAAGEPLSLLASGERDALIGLALRPPSQERTTPQVSAAAQQAAGVPGWLSPISQRTWIRPALSQDELYQEMARLNPPAAVADAEQEASAAGDDGSPYTAYGFIPE